MGGRAPYVTKWSLGSSKTDIGFGLRGGQPKKQRTELHTALEKKKGEKKETPELTQLVTDKEVFDFKFLVMFSVCWQIML